MALKDFILSGLQESNLKFLFFLGYIFFLFKRFSFSNINVFPTSDTFEGFLCFVSSL